MAENGISRHRRDRDLDYFAIFWRGSKYYPFHPSIWLFRLADPKPQFTKETEFKNKHSLRTSAFIFPFLGIIPPFNRLSIIGSFCTYVKLLYCVTSSSLAYRISSNKPPGAYLRQEILIWGGGCLFEGGGLLVRLRIDIGAYLDIRKLKWGLNCGGGGRNSCEGQAGLGNKILGEILGTNPFKPQWGLFEGGGLFEKYFISTRCKKFDLTHMGCYSRAGLICN